MRHLLTFAVLLLGGAAITFCADGDPGASLALPWVSSPRISPDGTRVVYEVLRADEKADRYRRDLWIVSSSGSPPRPLAVGASSNSDARWSPDGSRIGWISRREDAPQVYVARADGRGDHERWTSSKTGISSFEWSPTGRDIAFIASDPPAASPPVPAKRLFTVVGAATPEADRLWVAPARAGGAPAALSDPSLSVESFAWSPDGSRIAFSASSKGVSEPWRRTDLFVTTLSGKTSRLTKRDGFDTAPVWSPDGRHLAFLTSAVALGRPYRPAGNAYITVIGSDGAGESVMTRDFDERPSPVAWIGDRILFTALARTAQHLYSLDSDSGRIERVSSPAEGVFRDFDVTQRGALTFVASYESSLPEVSISAGSPFLSRALTRYGATPGGSSNVTREVVRWVSKDALPVEGVLIRRRDLDLGIRHPLLVILHTGPINLFQPVMASSVPYPVDAFVERGALVLEPNYRGSAGYGEAFRRALVGHLGQPEVDDVVSGVEALVARGFVDPARVGAMGWSHGGYIAAMISAVSDRFAAISAGAGVSDWQTYYTQSDAGNWAADYHGGDPWQSPEAFRRTAPLTYIRSARTPTLIQHGERDARAPIAGSYELRRALLDQKVPVEMIVYDGAGHDGGGFTLSQLRALLVHNTQWFGHHLWGDPAPSWRRAP